MRRRIRGTSNVCPGSLSFTVTVGLFLFIDHRRLPEKKRSAVIF